jgi:putative transposase
MASLNSFAVLEWIRKMQDVDNVDFLRELLRLIAQFLIDTEATEKIGAERYERTQERTTQQNSYRRREWDTWLGTVERKIPKLRQGSFFPSLLEPRRRAEQALVAVVQEAYFKGVSTRKVDDLVRALGLDGISKSEVSRLCQRIDEQVRQFKGTAVGTRVSVCVAGCHLPEGTGGRSGADDGFGGGHRRHGNW